MLEENTRSCIKHEHEKAVKQAKYKAAKKLLCRAQKQAHAVQWRDITTALITSCQNNNRDDFYRLVKRQRAIPCKKASIDFGKHKDSNSDANSWANYFKDLATPKDDPSFAWTLPENKLFTTSTYCRKQYSTTSHKESNYQAYKFTQIKKSPRHLWYIFWTFKKRLSDNIWCLTPPDQ